MFSSSRRALAAGAVLSLVLATAAVASAAEPAQATRLGEWAGTWESAASGTVSNLGAGYPNYSVRNIVHTSVGGSRARIKLTNALGTTPVLMGKATVAVAASPGTPDAAPGTMRTLTFSGASSITIPAGAEVLSDPVPLVVPEDGDLLVTTFTPEPPGKVTYHQVANQVSYLAPDGDHAADDSAAAFTKKITFWPYISGVDVQGTADGSVVAFGDSITDGNNSTQGANHRWPDYLADRLIAAPGPTRLVCSTRGSARTGCSTAPGTPTRCPEWTEMCLPRPGLVR